MKSREAVLQMIRDGSSLIQFMLRDRRCLDQLMEFFPSTDWPLFGSSLVPGCAAPTPRDWTEAVVVERLRVHTDIAISMAENHHRSPVVRSIIDLVTMWLWILDDPVSEMHSCFRTGLSFLRDVRHRYFGDDRSPKTEQGRTVPASGCVTCGSDSVEFISLVEGLCLQCGDRMMQLPPADLIRAVAKASLRIRDLESRIAAELR